MRAAVLATLCAYALCGCSGSESDSYATVVVAEGPAKLWVRAEGELRAAKATTLRVPGQNFAPRQLTWTVADGSHVKFGDLVARFGAPQSKLELDKALIEIQRNSLARAAKESELGVGLDRVEVDLAQAESALVIARRYARADFDALARNIVLDAIEDEEFLGERTSVLRWRQNQSEQRGAAELNVLGVQRGNLETHAQTMQGDLSALELLAPHDGIFMLTPTWSGELPRVGEQLWATSDFATIPDTGTLEVELRLSQFEAQTVAIGQKAELAPVGFPEQQVVGEVTWVATSSRPISRQNPARFLSMKASVPAEHARKFAWVPRQAFTARIVLLDAERTITVPNIALSGSGERAEIKVMEDGRVIEREVVLGVRGPSRTQVLEGLRAGDRVVIASGSTSTAARSNSDEATPPGVGDPGETP